MSKVVLITGGSSGLGKATGEYLSSKGFIVYGTSRNPEKVKEEFPFYLIKMDVKDSNSIHQGISKVLGEQKRLDVLINNAGMGITGPIEETPLEEIRGVFETNLYGSIEVIKGVLPTMRTQKAGLIINITSIAGYMGLPYRGVYSATKGALELITEALRMEVKDFGVHITNLAPGDFATNIASGRYHAPLLDNSPYHKPYGDTLRMMDDHVDQGGDPMLVARLIYQIINTKKPKIHYKAGAFMQKFSIVLKRLLPSKTYEKLLINHYKL
ncbi:SDR family oxidoreductase [Ascidiimonas sp. W6]|uniref:SDR family oxidoreductase n=1 Tax=Ascidiimonas meishanensis TaxID=3128903 RepID=UPI0030EBBF1D